LHVAEGSVTYTPAGCDTQGAITQRVDKLLESVKWHLQDQDEENDDDTRYEMSATKKVKTAKFHADA
ncbi:18467_t:CDS:2, partial [Funneliformis geosporum]